MSFRRRPPMATMHHTSRVYLEVPVVAPESITLNAQTVEMSLVAYGTDPGAWTAAQWHPTQDADSERDAILLVGEGSPTELLPGTYSVWVRISDNPERPVLHAGGLRVT